MCRDGNTIISSSFPTLLLFLGIVAGTNHNQTGDITGFEDLSAAGTNIFPNHRMIFQKRIEFTQRILL
jgi:hypothetical protein